VILFLLILIFVILPLSILGGVFLWPVVGLEGGVLACSDEASPCRQNQPGSKPNNALGVPQFGPVGHISRSSLFLLHGSLPRLCRKDKPRPAVPYGTSHGNQSAGAGALISKEVA